MNEQEIILQQDLGSLRVKELHDIMRASNDLLKSQHRVSTTGRKQDLVNRFSSFLMGLLSNQNQALINSIVNIVNREAGGRFRWAFNNNEIASSNSRYRKPKLWERQNAFALNQVKFKMEPFFKTVSIIKPPQLIPASSSRNSITLQFNLTAEQQQLLSTPLESDGKAKYEVRYCCAVYSTHSQLLETGLPLEFPNTCELKVNNVIINNNTLRCIKGKPGTIHPADLSTGIAKTGSNNVELIYVQTHQQFVAGIYVVERKTITSFIEEMKYAGRLTKDKVLEKLKTTSEDADIVVESETLSTKCPLAFIRIQTPCRSVHCNHLQCFDANTFLAMNEQTPTWSCPVCYKTIANANDLAIDEYFSDMLKMVPSGVESVKVELDGTIIMNQQEEAQSLDSSDDEDGATSSNNNNNNNSNQSVKAEETEKNIGLLHIDDNRSENNNTHNSNDNAIIVLDDSDDDATNDDTDDGRNDNNQTIQQAPSSEQQYPMDDPLQIQLQQQIQLQLQHQDNPQYPPYNNALVLQNGHHHPPPFQFIPNGYPQPPSQNGNGLVVPGKSTNPPASLQAPPPKRHHTNVIDLTFSDDEA